MSFYATAQNPFRYTALVAACEDLLDLHHHERGSRDICLPLESVTIPDAPVMHHKCDLLPPVLQQTFAWSTLPACNWSSALPVQHVF